ncbi:MAG TPA: hypothetical protein VLH85_09725 [Levilinea sp.]|nr:hypothetical protein [Levilinea sp.]
MIFLEDKLDNRQRAILAALDSPAAIQAYLDTTLYSPENDNRCPVSVLRDNQAHCLDGALFAAAALRRLGFPPLLVDMLPEPGTDDDHVLAIFRQNGLIGAVAKSNFAGLRFREPLYRSLRELVMSYFEWFFNLHGQKTLRSYTRPLDLSKYDHSQWMWRDSGADFIEKRLVQLKHIALFPQEMSARLNLVDPLTKQAGMLGVNEAGLYKPKK